MHWWLRYLPNGEWWDVTRQNVTPFTIGDYFLKSRNRCFSGTDLTRNSAPACNLCQSTVCPSKILVFRHHNLTVKSYPLRHAPAVPLHLSFSLAHPFGFWWQLINEHCHHPWLEPLPAEQGLLLDSGVIWGNLVMAMRNHYGSHDKNFNLTRQFDRASLHH